MNWVFILTLLTGTVETIEQTSVPIEKPDEPVQQEPNIELLLFLAEWDDSDNDQWLDPEIFATDDTMNQQLEIKKAKQNETDPDHN